MDKVAFSLFGKEIYWYGIIIACALVIGVILGIREAKRRGFRSEMILDFMLITIPISIVCARLFYVIFAKDLTGANPYWSDPASIIAIWKGGLAIYGAVIGGVISAFIFFKWRRVPIGDVLDIAAPSLIIAQAIGRWGNFVNQEAHGEQILDKAWQWFPAGVKIIENGQPIWYQATFFYEFAWNVIVFILLMIVKTKIKFRGGIFALYLAGYGFGRFFIEGLRTDSLMIGDIRISKALSVLFVVGGLAYVVIMSRRKKQIELYDGVYAASWSEDQIKEYKANEKSNRAKEKAERAQSKVSRMQRKNETADGNVKKAEGKVAKEKKKLAKIEEKIAVLQIKIKSADSPDASEKEKQQAQKAKEKIEKLNMQINTEKNRITKANAGVKKAEEKAAKVDIKTKKAEENALKKSTQAKSAQIKAQKAKNKAIASDTEPKEPHDNDA